MAVVLESYTTATGTTSLTLNKPTGLAEGDLLVAIVAGPDTPPAGFTQQLAAASNYNFRVYTKTATSTDVSASNFTFTGSSQAAGVMCRVSGWYQMNDKQIVEQAGSGTAQSYSVSIDLIVPNSLAIMAFLHYQTASTTSATYTITGQTNPTWTEMLDAYNATDDFNFASAYATLSADDSLTAIGVTASNTLSSWTKGLVVVITQTQDGNGSASLLVGTPTILTPTSGAGTSGTATLLEGAPTVNAPAASVNNQTWTNESGTTTTWTNET